MLGSILKSTVLKTSTICHCWTSDRARSEKAFISLRICRCFAFVVRHSTSPKNFVCLRINYPGPWQDLWLWIKTLFFCISHHISLVAKGEQTSKANVHNSKTFLSFCYWLCRFSLHLLPRTMKKQPKAWGKSVSALTISISLSTAGLSLATRSHWKLLKIAAVCASFLCSRDGKWIITFFIWLAQKARSEMRDFLNDTQTQTRVENLFLPYAMNPQIERRKNNEGVSLNIFDLWYFTKYYLWSNISLHSSRFRPFAFHCWTLETTDYTDHLTTMETSAKQKLFIVKIFH